LSLWSHGVSVVVVRRLRPSWWPSHHAATLMAGAMVDLRHPALVPCRPFGCHVADSDVVAISAA
jgi:hypothetical protein